MPCHWSFPNRTMTLASLGFIHAGSGLSASFQPQMKFTQGSTGRFA